MTLSRTDTITRASRPQLGDTFAIGDMHLSVVSVNIHFIGLAGDAPGALFIPFHKWPTVITATINEGATFTPAN